MEERELQEALLSALLAEDPAYTGLAVPQDPSGRRRLIRALMNVRPPRPAGGTLLRLQDELLALELARKTVVRAGELPPAGADGRIALWRGDITCLEADAIVNAANSALLGCFIPCHGCIDNAIHSAAGIRLRLECARLMRLQGAPEPVGRAKLTPGYALPSRYVLHTVGPCLSGAPTGEDRLLLALCYHTCLALAEEKGLRSVAFCCISTGEFRFPQDAAAEIAVETVQAYLSGSSRIERVVFDVFTERDERLYRELLA